jgi:hypothetical protein
VATDEFIDLAREAAHAQGLVGPRIVCVAHPIGGIDEETLRSRAAAASEAVLSMLNRD